MDVIYITVVIGISMGNSLTVLMLGGHVWFFYWFTLHDHHFGKRKAARVAPSAITRKGVTHDFCSDIKKIKCDAACSHFRFLSIPD